MRLQSDSPRWFPASTGCSLPPQASTACPIAKMLHVQIICLRSLGHKVVDYELVRQSMCVFAERAAEKLREEKQYY
ncbi:TPA: hypothetical protein ACS8BP_003713 [Providencia alcalifaciens]|uniref:hypothetical protein n=1 Tax=Providencia TaxID=586 RepID=UPI0012B5F709|nr:MULTISPECIES: hypothetical protein [Providencia]MTC48225.1 hypothetical protein [Providencia alcalifaciens]